MLFVDVDKKQVNFSSLRNLASNELFFITLILIKKFLKTFKLFSKGSRLKVIDNKIFFSPPRKKKGPSLK